VNKKIIATLIVLAAFIGMLDTSYLTIKHLKNGDVTCSVLNGCEQVLNSAYSTLFGQPLAIWGLLYYLTLFSLAVLLIIKPSKQASIVLTTISGFGLIFSSYLIYLQAYVIESWCQYCLLSVITTLIIFISSIFLLPSIGPKPTNKSEEL